MSRASRIFIGLRVTIPSEPEGGEELTNVTGIESVTAVGTLGFTKEGTVPLTGIESVTAVGANGVTYTIPVTGINSPTGIGTADKTNDQNITGINSPTDIGTVDKINDQTITGIQSATAVGTVTVPVSGLNNVRISVMYFQQMYAPIAMGE